MIDILMMRCKDLAGQTGSKNLDRELTRMYRYLKSTKLVSPPYYPPKVVTIGAGHIDTVDDW